MENAFNVKRWCSHAQTETIDKTIESSIPINEIQFYRKRTISIVNHAELAGGQQLQCTFQCCAQSTTLTMPPLADRIAKIVPLGQFLRSGYRCPSK